MNLNHVSNRLNAQHFDTIIKMFKSHLGFVELRRTRESIWMRQSDANVDLQFKVSESTNRDADRSGSQVAFLSETPNADLEKLADWLHERGLDATVGCWSDKEYFLDVPAAFVNFVIEAMTPDMAEYDGF